MLIYTGSVLFFVRKTVRIQFIIVSEVSLLSESRRLFITRSNILSLIANQIAVEGKSHDTRFLTCYQGFPPHERVLVGVNRPVSNRPAMSAGSRL